MAISHEHVGWKISAKIKIYILSRAKLLCSLCHETHCSRYHPRFFDQVGHQTTYASMGNKHSFTKSWHRKTYQNYEQSTKIGQIFRKQSTLKVKVLKKKSLIKVLHRKEIRKIPLIFDAEKWLLKYKFGNLRGSCS
jgi:hypothetical protein